MKISLISIFLFFSGITLAQDLSRSSIEADAHSNLRKALEDFRKFLEIPNNGLVESDIWSNLNYCDSIVQDLNFKTKVYIKNGVPNLFAQGEQDPSKKTILVYLQIDGQPVDSSAWNQASPYIPVLKEEEGGKFIDIPWDRLDKEINPSWKIFARSASDSKGPAMIFFTALRILKEKNISPSVNIKMILDFQEEMSSPTLAKVIEENESIFKADGILIMDGTRHFSNLPNLAFGARGIVTASLKIFGAKNNLHSGQYGNFAPNPAFQISKLISAMKSEDGKVLIPGFYDGVSISESDFLTMSSIPENNEKMAHEMGFAFPESVGRNYQEALQFPSLNIRGLKSGWVGEEVRTLIPSDALVEFDIRTVKETPNERQIALLQKFIIDQGFYLIDGEEPTEQERITHSKLASFSYRIGSEPFRAEMDTDFAKWLDKGMSHIFGTNYIKTRQTGGSQPMAPFITILGIPAVSVRIPNPDNNIHGPNENIKIKNFEEGIQTCLSLLVQEF